MSYTSGTPCTKWSQEEDDIIREWRGRIPLHEIAEKLPGRTTAMVQSHLAYMREKHRIEHPKKWKGEVRKYVEPHHKTDSMEPRPLPPVLLPKPRRIEFDPTPCSERELGYVR